MNKETIAQTLEYLNPSQTAGIGCLAFLAIREKSSLQYQREEMDFDDIPLNHLFHEDIDDDSSLLEIALLIAEHLMKKYVRNEERTDHD
jgi:hypothetical protein